MEGIAWPALPDNTHAAILAIEQQFERIERLTADAILALQFRQLRSLLSHAAGTVPFYRDRLRGMAGREPLLLEDWLRIPVLDRSALQDAGETMLSRALPKEHGAVSVASSSGSTGRPVKVKTTSVTSLFFVALNLRSHRWGKRDFAGTVCAIRALSSETRKAADEGKPTPWVPGHPSGPLYFYDIALPVGGQLEWLQAKAPHYLLTNPSNLQALVDLTRERGVRLPSLRQVAILGEALSPEVRTSCQTTWQVPVQDLYSCVELGIMALQCPDNEHSHVMSDSVLIEVLHDDGRPCAAGEIGQVVVTDLHNFAQPLIRYAVGDYAEVGPTCPCGRGLPVLRRVWGRERNMVTLPSGDRLWPDLPTSAWMDIAPVRQLQFIQHSVEEIEARLVTTRALSRLEEERLAQAFAGLFKHPFTFRFTYLAEIPRDKGGKYEGFISRVAAIPGRTAS